MILPNPCSVRTADHLRKAAKDGPRSLENLLWHGRPARDFFNQKHGRDARDARASNKFSSSVRTLQDFMEYPDVSRFLAKILFVAKSGMGASPMAMVLHRIGRTSASSVESYSDQFSKSAATNKGAA